MISGFSDLISSSQALFWGARTGLTGFFPVNEGKGHVGFHSGETVFADCPSLKITRSVVVCVFAIVVASHVHAHHHRHLHIPFSFAEVMFCMAEIWRKLTFSC